MQMLFVTGGNSQVTLKNILAWVTGSDGLPAVTYVDTPTIIFIPGCLPKTNSCMNILKLPLDIENYQVFRETMNNCIKLAKDFANP